jgi:hypothetical protein
MRGLPAVVSIGVAIAGFVLWRTTNTRPATLEKGLRAIEDGERESPKDRWDPQYIVDHVGADDTALFAWVRENTFWVPYHGLLRGAAGVLMDSLGNSLDRSVLLATLLQDAGFTVRLAHAELSTETAMALLPRLTDRPSAKPERSDDPAAFERDVRAIAAQYQLDASAGIDRTDRIATAAAALRDHWWVQRQDGTNWIDLDIDVPSREPGKVFLPAAETVELNDAGSARSHEVVVRVIAERTLAGTSAESPVFEYALRPVDVLGQPIVLQFWPMDWPPDFRPTGSDPKQAFRKTVLAQHEWDAALVVGSKLVKRSVVNDAGEIEDTRGSSVPFGSTGDAFSKSMGLSKRPAGQELTAVWIEYETRVPGQPDRKTRRAVFDIMGPAARASKRIPSSLNDDSKVLRSLSLMMRTEILPQMCRIAPEYLAHLLSDSVLKNRNLLPAAIREELGDPSTAMQTLASKGTAGPSPLYEIAIARFDLNPSRDHVYIDRPAILSRHSLPVWRPDGVIIRDAADIVTNDIGVDLLAEDSFWVRLQQGVIDANLEQLGKSIGGARDVVDRPRLLPTRRAAAHMEFRN